MPASEARMIANRKNAERSTGPKTEEGKERSRANSLKHGMTGAGVVLPQADAAEVDRRAAAFAIELDAEGEVGKALSRRAALNSVRMERLADQQAAALSERVRRVEAEFVVPDGVDEAEAAGLRAEAVRAAMFDPSKEATLARRYENAAERAFFRCLKELRQRSREARSVAKVDVNRQAQAMLGSFLQAQQAFEAEDAEFAAMYEELNIPQPSRPLLPPYPAHLRGGVDVPLTVGRPR